MFLLASGLLALGLFAVALLFALTEIHVEGFYGWAEKLPTWFRTTGVAAKVWGFVSNSRPLTGYHLFANGMLVAMFHLKYCEGVRWSGSAELMTISEIFAMFAVWDFLWFVLNPSYTLKNYRRANIWWFSKSYWILGKFPVDYAWAFGISLLMAYLSGLIVGNGLNTLQSQLAVIGFLLVLTIITIILSPIYHRWHKKMMMKDDRDKAGIFH